MKPSSRSSSHRALQIQKAHKELKKKVAYHGYLYYVLDQPEISDRHYDRLFQKLLSMEQQYGSPLNLDIEDSPTQRVGGEPLLHFEKIPHTTPMLSLSNTYSDADMQAFWERCQKLQKEVEE